MTGFRYNSGGQLINPIFPAAAAIGMGSRPDPSQGVLQQNAQLQLQQNQQISQLQQAHDAMLNRQGVTSTPSSGTYFSKVAPLAESVTASKQLALSTIDPSDLSDQQKELFNQQVGNPGVQPQDFLKLVQTAAAANKTKKQQEEQAQRDQDSQARSAQAETDRQKREQSQQQALQQQLQTKAIQDQINQQTTDVNNRRSALMKIGLGHLLDRQEQSPELLQQMAGGDPQAVQDIQAYRQSKQKLDSLNQQLQSGTGQGQPQYQEGQILHSPSTGRTFKIVNGQPMEIPNAG